MSSTTVVCILEIQSIGGSITSLALRFTLVTENIPPSCTVSSTLAGLSCFSSTDNKPYTCVCQNNTYKHIIVSIITIVACGDETRDNKSELYVDYTRYLEPETRLHIVSRGTYRSLRIRRRHVSTGPQGRIPVRNGRRVKFMFLDSFWCNMNFATIQRRRFFGIWPDDGWTVSKWSL